MPLGYSLRCKVCNTPLRPQIERWATEEGLSCQAISKRLKSEFGLAISHNSVWQHIREHFNVSAEVKARAAQSLSGSEGQFEQAVQKRISEIQMLADVIRGNHELYIKAKAWLDEIVSARERPPATLVELLSVVASELRQAAKQKQELLGEDAMSRLADGVATWAELVDAVGQEPALPPDAAPGDAG